jgi:Glycine/sarcosine/betaine reductase selenoprotein B (GRDB)
MSEPIAYLQRTRRYYAALGYPPYQWAHFDTVPFCRPRRGLAAARLALVTTAARFDPALGEQGPGAAYNAGAKFYRVYRVPREPAPDLRISHVGYDRAHTTAADPNTWLPIRALQDAVKRGVVGSLADDVIGLPTNRSQRTTLTQDADAVLDTCIALAADVALLVPNCPVCHQSTALVARHLEAHGIATVVMGCARDIVEWVGVARFSFSDFPLGNSAGKPFDDESQRATLAHALALFDAAGVPRTTAVSAQRWGDDDAWKIDFMNVDVLPPEDIARSRAEFAEQKRIAERIRADGR